MKFVIFVCARNLELWWNLTSCGRLEAWAVVCYLLLMHLLKLIVFNLIKVVIFVHAKEVELLYWRVWNTRRVRITRRVRVWNEFHTRLL
jgi:hypothetical protein